MNHDHFEAPPLHCHHLHALQSALPTPLLPHAAVLSAGAGSVPPGCAGGQLSWSTSSPEGSCSSTCDDKGLDAA